MPNSWAMASAAKLLPVPCGLELLSKVGKLPIADFYAGDSPFSVEVAAPLSWGFLPKPLSNSKPNDILPKDVYLALKGIVFFQRLYL